eukprot:7420909-Pyramimonas_sp.AAC.1
MPLPQSCSAPGQGRAPRWMICSPPTARRCPTLAAHLEGAVTVCADIHVACLADGVDHGAVLMEPLLWPCAPAPQRAHAGLAFRVHLPLVDRMSSARIGSTSSKSSFNAPSHLANQIEH